MKRPFVFFVFIALSACGGQEPSVPGPNPPVNPGPKDPGDPSCNGCTFNGLCTDGTSVAACGSGGNVCVTCGSGYSCLNHQCVETAPLKNCNANTCDGCCDEANDLCVKPEERTPQLCGTGGNTCSACGVDEECNPVGACVAKPTQFNVVMASANLDFDPDCDNFNSAPDCDMIVYLEFGGQSYQTDYIVDDHSPEWNKVVFSATRNELLNYDLELDIDDHDSVFSNNDLGECSWRINQDHLDARQLLIPQCGDVKDVLIKFEPI